MILEGYPTPSISTARVSSIAIMGDQPGVSVAEISNGNAVFENIMSCVPKNIIPENFDKNEPRDFISVVIYFTDYPGIASYFEVQILINPDGYYYLYSNLEDKAYGPIRIPEEGDIWTTLLSK